jgi:hypothetical protein
VREIQESESIEKGFAQIRGAEKIPHIPIRLLASQLVWQTGKGYPPDPVPSYTSSSSVQHAGSRSVSARRVKQRRGQGLPSQSSARSAAMATEREGNQQPRRYETARVRERQRRFFLSPEKKEEDRRRREGWRRRRRLRRGSERRWWRAWKSVACNCSDGGFSSLAPSLGLGGGLVDPGRKERLPIPNFETVKE